MWLFLKHVVARASFYGRGLFVNVASSRIDPIMDGMCTPCAASPRVPAPTSPRERATKRVVSEEGLPDPGRSGCQGVGEGEGDLPVPVAVPGAGPPRSAPGWMVAPVSSFMN